MTRHLPLSPRSGAIPASDNPRANIDAGLTTADNFLARIGPLVAGANEGRESSFMEGNCQKVNWLVALVW